jgi:hypothetical protein
MTVSGDIDSTSAVSAMLSPPKKRSSTTRLRRSSTFASARSASSSAIRCGSSSDVRSASLSDTWTAAASLLRPFGARDVHEDPAHERRGHREKVRPVLPVHVLRVNQPKIRLVHQRRGLKAVARPLASHAAPGDAPQLLMDERRQLGERFLVARSPGQQEAGHATW